MTVKMKITRKDFKLDTYTASGPGGQHRNRSKTAVRITHIPSGTSAECSTYKSQKQNRDEAFRKLAERLKPWIEEQMQVNKFEAERNNGRVRTYNEARNVVQNEDGEITLRYDEVMKSSDISKLIHERRNELGII